MEPIFVNGCEVSERCKHCGWMCEYMDSHVLHANIDIITDYDNDSVEFISCCPYINERFDIEIIEGEIFWTKKNDDKIILIEL
jgi:hypothetical protein